MSSFKLNDAEDLILINEPDHLYKLYTGIRKHIDFETGIAGEKRRLSEEYLMERLSYEPKKGRPGYRCPREKIRTGIRNLEKLGLIKPLGNYVFLCILADKDQSVSGRCNQGTTITTTNTATKKNNVSILKDKEKGNLTQPEVQPDYMPRYNPHPVSGNNINNLYTSNCEFEGENEKSFAVDNSFDQFWAAWGNKKGKSTAQRIWKKKKLAKHISEILADIAERKKLGYFVDKKFVPHGSTYLNKELWKDEDKGPQHAPTAKQVKAANDDEMATAEDAYFAIELNGGSASSPYSFPAEVISCISGFRNLKPAVARSEFIRVYNQRKPIWIARRQETQNRGG